MRKIRCLETTPATAGTGTAQRPSTAITATVISEKWDRKYPAILKSWDRNWAELTAFFEYPTEIRRIICTTNAVESYHRAVRKFTKSKAIFPTDDSIRKVIYMSVEEIARKWTMPVRDWSLAYAQFAIWFEDRFTA